VPSSPFVRRSTYAASNSKRWTSGKRPYDSRESPRGTGPGDAADEFHGVDAHASPHLLHVAGPVRNAERLHLVDGRVVALVGMDRYPVERLEQHVTVDVPFEDLVHEQRDERLHRHLEHV